MSSVGSRRKNAQCRLLQGSDGLGRDLFLLSFFQLVEAWRTAGTDPSPATFSKFLCFLMHRIAEVVEIAPAALTPLAASPGADAATAADAGGGDASDALVAASVVPRQAVCGV